MPEKSESRSSSTGRFFAQVRDSIPRLLTRDLGDLTPREARLAYIIRLLRETWREIKRDQCPLRATALAYKTLLSLIPLLAIVMSLLVTREKQRDLFLDWVVGRIYPVEQAGADQPLGQADAAANERQKLRITSRASLKEAIDKFAENAATGVGAVGLLLLVGVFVWTMRTIEESFNAIWGARENRPLSTQITRYSALLIWGPLLVLGSISFTQYMHTTASAGLLFSVPGIGSQDDLGEGVLSQELRAAFGKQEIDLPDRVTIETEKEGIKWRVTAENEAYIVEKEDETLNISSVGMTWLRSWLINYVFPFVVTFVALLSMYFWLPNTHVRWRPGLIGVAVGTFMFEVCKHGFSSYAVQVVSYSKVYGTLSVIPLMMVWFYLSWMVVLFGVEVAFVAQNFKDLTTKDERIARASRWRSFYAVRAIQEIGERFMRGQEPLTVQQLADRFSLPEYEVLSILARLQEKGLVERTDRKDVVYLPAKDLDTLSVGEIVAAIAGEALESPDGLNQDPDAKRVGEIFDAAREAVQRKLRSSVRSLTQLAKTPPPASEKESEPSDSDAAESSAAPQKPAAKSDETTEIV